MMTEAAVHVKVHPHASRDAVVRHTSARFEVWVRAKPQNGAATRAVARLLADTLGVPPTRVQLVRGAAARDKVFRVSR